MPEIFWRWVGAAPGYAVLPVYLNLPHTVRTAQVDAGLLSLGYLLNGGKSGSYQCSDFLRVGRRQVASLQNSRNCFFPLSVQGRRLFHLRLFQTIQQNFSSCQWQSSASPSGKSVLFPSPSRTHRPPQLTILSMVKGFLFCF